MDRSLHFEGGETLTTPLNRQQQNSSTPGTWPFTPISNNNYNSFVSSANAAAGGNNYSTGGYGSSQSNGISVAAATAREEARLAARSWVDTLRRQHGGMESQVQQQQQQSENKPPSATKLSPNHPTSSPSSSALQYPKIIPPSLSRSTTTKPPSSSTTTPPPSLVLALEEHVEKQRKELQTAAEMSAAEKVEMQRELDRTRERVLHLETSLEEEHARFLNANAAKTTVTDEALLLERQRVREMKELREIDAAKISLLEKEGLVLQQRLQAVMEHSAKLQDTHTESGSDHQQFINFLQDHLRRLEEEVSLGENRIKLVEDHNKVLTEMVDLLTESLRAAGMDRALQNIKAAMSAKWDLIQRESEIRANREARIIQTHTVIAAKDKHELLLLLKEEQRKSSKLESEVLAEKSVSAKLLAELETMRVALEAEGGVVEGAKETSLALAELCKQRAEEREKERREWDSERRQLIGQVQHWESKYNSAIHRARAAETAKSEGVLQSRGVDAELAAERRRLAGLIGEIDALQLRLSQSQKARLESETELEQLKKVYKDESMRNIDIIEHLERRIVQLERQPSKNETDLQAVEAPLLRLRLDAANEELESLRTDLEAKQTILNSALTKEKLATAEVARLKEKEKNLWKQVESLEQHIQQDHKTVDEVVLSRQEYEIRLKQAEADQAKAERDALRHQQLGAEARAELAREVARRSKAEETLEKVRQERLISGHIEGHTTASVQNLTEQLNRQTKELQALMKEKEMSGGERLDTILALQKTAAETRAKRMESTVARLRHQLLTHGITPLADVHTEE